ncbi:Membrane protein involved in the export of O-antigen and teichoic acid [Tropicibacter naphthalenivorans]|uniref:Polysaccharide biosynthesis protein n=2 Tax=Tropicibacter naphthalenivorans TaxID=441103 RepID=A0A0P1GYC5_9RHOB|nr:hypothetical protein TRN7648_03906 [Tropicibacter naphthalenivorans]SMD05588.1 Membrane protein involved in the export of O-antigen and teichoic acid [Tropicibacter naphthalenivorans]
MLARLFRSSYAYVVINTAVSLLAFGRNLLFMNSLGLAEVGQIALMQTIVMLVGFAQGGLISGAFILWAGGDRDLNRRMADVLFAGKAVLGIVLALGLAVLGPGVLMPTVAPETLTIGLAAGLATLASTWMNNVLVADQKLRQSNLVNVVAVLVSLGLALLTLGSGDLQLALLSIAVQPLLVALGGAVLEPQARPRAARPEGAALRRMLAVGVMPFLGSLSLLLIYQIERWSIAGVMGPEALGRYYIVILYMTFFLLVPTALMNVHFPRARRALAAGDTDGFRRTIRRHMVELAVYAGLALLVKLVLLSLVLDSFLPNFSGTEPLVYLAFLTGLGMLAQAPGTLVLYAVEDTRPVLIAGLVSLGSFCALLGAVWLAGFTLTAVLVARILSAALGAVYLLWQRHVALTRLDRKERAL